MIEFVIHKFINTPATSVITLPSPVLNNSFSSDDWTQDEMDTLYWYFVQSKKSQDVVGNIIELIKDSGRVTKSRIAVIQQLLQQDIVISAEYDDLILMKFENSQYEREVKSRTNVDGLDDESAISQTNAISEPDDIRVSFINNATATKS